MKLSQHKQTHFRVGVVGLPTGWEVSYGSALATLAERVRITAIYDPHPALANVEGKKRNAAAVAGVIALARRTDVDGLVILKTGWTRHHLLPHVAMIAKPVFLGIEPLKLEVLEYLHSIVTLNRAIWVPALPHRFAPSTTRLMELVATQLGAPRRIEIVVPALEDAWTRGELVKTIDWAFFVIHTLTAVQSVRIDQEGCRLCCLNAAGDKVHVVIVNARDGEEPKRTIKCGRGEAIVTTDRRIDWRITGGALTRETLAGENDAHGMQLAVFLRRAAGGLIPTADLSDLHRSQVAAEQISAARF